MVPCCAPRGGWSAPLPEGAEDSVEDSAAAWWRLGAALILATIGGVGLWSSVVVLPFIEADFGIDRGGGYRAD